MKWLTHLIYGENDGAMEAVNGMILLAWGLWVGQPAWPMFDVAPAYSAFVWPDWAWGGVAAFLGGLQLAGLYFRRWQVRRVATLASVVFWMFVWVAFVVGDYRSTATVIYPFLVAGNARSHIRLRISACRRQCQAEK